MSDLLTHRLSRELEGHVVLFPLPLCWDAETSAKPDHDDEDWWTAWDQGAVDPTELLFAVPPAEPTCRPCLVWIHA